MESRMPFGYGGGKNVGAPERWISAAAGGALLYYGMKTGPGGRTFGRGLLALAGISLLLRGALGKSLLYRALGLTTAEPDAGGAGIHVEKAVFIDRSPEDVYRFWRNFENLPRIMDHLKAVRGIDDRTSHWVAKGPAGLEVEWDAELVDDQENRRIAWRSLEGSEVQSHGSVIFNPGTEGRGAELRVSLDYLPPAGKAGLAMAKLFGEDPERSIGEDLNRFKALMESGEIAVVQAG